MTRLQDAHGHAVSTASRAALDASEKALWRMMTFYGVPLEDLDAAIAADPGWALPHAMKAGFLLSLTEPGVLADARDALAAATARSDGATDREKHHLHALSQLAAGDWAGAAETWDTHLAQHPRDALALQWAHLFDFYRGDAPRLEARIARALPAWRASDPLYPCVLGLRAFGLEERGRYDEAEAAGRRALEHDPRVPWATHAVAHVMEMQGRFAEGSRWLAEQRPHWGEGNGFSGHLGWHEALFALEARDHARALAVFDAYLDAELNEIMLQRVDAASLLWRLALHGADVGNRWQRLLARWPLDDTVAGHSAFNDVHAAFALVGAGDPDRAEAWAATSLARAAQGGTWNRTVSREIAAPLLRGIVAFGRGHDADAWRALEPLPAVAARLGGSIAQRDVIEQTLLAAAARGGLHAAGRARLAARERGRAPTPLASWWARALG